MTSYDYSSYTVQTDASTNNLHDYIEQGSWKEVGALLKQKVAVDMASMPCRHRHGDLPLHAICDFKFDDRWGNHNIVTESRQEAVFPPPSSLILGVLKAYPEAAKVKGARGCLPLH